MAEVSHLQPHGNHDDDQDQDQEQQEQEQEQEDDRDHVVVSFHPDNNCSCHLDGFDLNSLSFDRIPPNDNDSVVFDRENQMNFVIDMFHQRVEQSQSQSQSHSHSEFIDRNHRRLIEGNEESDLNQLNHDFDLGLGLGLGFPIEINNNRNNGDDNLGFMFADCGDDDFFVSRRTLNPRLDSENRSNRSIGDEYITGGFRPPDLGSETDLARENNIGFETDAFRVENDNERGNQDFEREGIDDRIHEREILNMIFESEAEDDLSVLPEIPTDGLEFEEQQQQPDTSSLEWEVLLDINNLEGNQDLGDGGGDHYYDEYNYAEYDMLFEQFADADVSSLGRPPAAKTVVENLLTVVMTELDVEKNDTLCAVCKDEIGVGLMGKLLPCGHRYHGDCIVPWLSIRNTCPVCRHELPTDDLEYERRKAEIGDRDR